MDEVARFEETRPPWRAALSVSTPEVDVARPDRPQSWTPMEGRPRLRMGFERACDASRGCASRCRAVALRFPLGVLFPKGVAGCRRPLADKEVPGFGDQLAPLGWIVRTMES